MQHRKKSLVNRLVQPKLEIGQPNDKYEKQADAVADRVIMMPDSEEKQLQMKPILEAPDISMKCAECEEEESVQMKTEEEEESVQMKPEVQKSGEATTTAAPAFSSRLHSTVGQGHPLPDKVSDELGGKIGADFSNVKVHTDSRAIQMSKEIGAQAFTHGQDIYFNKGKYDPGSAKGKHLLAHELTHVVQQADTAGPIQRTLNDGHDLTSPRFSGDLVLEGVYDNERLIMSGSRGPAVRKIQQALMDAGFDLPKYGVDGIFGAETRDAVMAFQRASGLTAGAGIDGIVGPTTMGWLDQLFSAGPTPAGTTPGATTGCKAFKTVSIDIISLNGSNRDPMADLDYANAVFNQCCVRFSLAIGASTGPQSDAWLGGDTDLQRIHSCSNVHAEENDMRVNGTALFGMASRIKVFYVESMNPPNRGLSFPPFCSSGARSSFVNHTYISNTAERRSLAHELGHILLNSGNHPADTNNLMHPTNTATGEVLTPAQRITIFTNA